MQGDELRKYVLCNFILLSVTPSAASVLVASITINNTNDVTFYATRRSLASLRTEDKRLQKLADEVRRKREAKLPAVLNS